MFYYLYTLDTHDIYGPFSKQSIAHNWAADKRMSRYMLMDEYVRSDKQFADQTAITPDGLEVIAQ